MELRIGQEFIGVCGESSRHYRILSLTPVHDYTKESDALVTHYNLKIEALHVKESNWAEIDKSLYNSYRYFDTTSYGLLKLVEMGIIKEKI